MNDKIIGIYSICNVVNGRMYIGSSRNIEKRFSQHRQAFRDGKRSNRSLQVDWDKYGGENFRFSIVEMVRDADELFDREQHWIDFIFPEYNVKMAHLGSNKAHNVDVRRRIGQAHQGKTVSSETRRKISESNTGKVRSEEVRKKISEIQRGRPISEKARRSREGRVLSEEHRRKISEAVKLDWETRRR